jgi:subtilase family serine protease
MLVAPADLAETAVSVLTTAPVSGGSVQVSDTLTNQGLGSAPGSNTGFYLSTNGTTKGTYLGYRSVGVLSPGGISGPLTTTLTLPTSLNGAYYIMACADYSNLVAEANKANNCMASAQITIAGADLVESSFTAPATAASGGSVQVSDTVTNQGLGNAGGSTTGFYLSTNGTTKGTYLGYRYIGVLSPGGTSGPATTTLTLPTNLSGTYYLIVCANYNNGIVETSTSNNCTTSTSMQVH